MAIGPVNTPPISQPPSPETPPSPKGAAAGDISKFQQGLNAPPPAKEDLSKLSAADLNSQIKALTEKASRGYPGLDDDEKLRLTLLNSELSDRSRRMPASQSPGGSILDRMR